MKIFKTFYKPQTATLLKETIHPPPFPPFQMKAGYFSRTNIFLTRLSGIY